MNSSDNKPVVTREDALKHIRAVEILHRGGAKIPDPVAYFNGQIAEIRERIARERQLEPEGAEMVRIRDWMSTEEYFRWLEGVLAFQEAYLAALSGN
jgi:hypothetical protein